MFDRGIMPGVSDFLDSNRYVHGGSWGGHYHTRGIRKIKQVSKRRRANKVARRSRKRNRT